MKKAEVKNLLTQQWKKREISKCNNATIAFVYGKHELIT